MIKVDNISKSFEDKAVFKNFSMNVNDGDVIGLVGINGSGKSTLLRLLSGVYFVDDGMISYNNENVYDNDLIKKDIFFLPDEPFYSQNTTPSSLLDLYKCFYNIDKDVYYSYLEKFKLPIKKSMHNFSKGMKRQTFISLAFSINPKYLLLDEAFDGLDPLAKQFFIEEIKKFSKEKNTTIIMSSHSLKEIENLCDSFVFIGENSSFNSEDTKKNYHKYQLAFNDLKNENDFEIDFASFESLGRVVKVIIDLNYDEFYEKIKIYNPLIIDEIDFNFEEIFILENKKGGK